MEKYWQFVKKVFASGDEDRAAEDTAPAVKYPFFKIVLDPYILSLDNLKKLSVIAGFYALLLTALYCVGAQSVFCLFSDYRQEGGYCTNSWLPFLSVHFLAFALMAMFSSRWYNACFNHTPAEWKWLLCPTFHDLKVFGFFLLFICLNALAFVSYFLLAVREPNPDWRIELVYFGIVSLGFLVPFVLMRFYAVIAVVLSGEKMPSPGLVWKKRGGNGLRTVLSLFIFFMLCVFSLSAYVQILRSPSVGYVFYILFIGEYLFNFICLLLVSVFINLCYLQKEFLFGENNHGTTD